VKINLVTLLISSAVGMATWWARHALISASSAHGRYYLTAILMISGILMVITLLRAIRMHRNRPMSVDNAVRKPSAQRRRDYRIRFGESPYPIFVQRSDDPHSVTEFTCPVYDISATGISLDCKGVYQQGDAVQGHIIFNSGRTAPINGIVVREEGQRCCLHLHCTIDPPLLMAEQRNRIVIDKASGPQPAVSKTLLDAAPDSLPSHAPKGICRLKRP
jgi:hypothetical protein